jgi:type VI secretion system secreted protein Hcp
MFLSRRGRFAMPTTAYLTLTGKAQGAIKGNVTAKGREGAIALLSVEYELSSPFDATTGLATGKRQHKPIVVTKAVDETSPSLLKALVTNEVLTTVKIDFWRPAPETAAPYFSITLTNAIVSDVTLKSSADEAKSETEQLQFVYQSIVWTWTPTGTSAQDDWNASG